MKMKFPSKSARPKEYLYLSPQFRVHIKYGALIIILAATVSTDEIDFVANNCGTVVGSGSTWIAKIEFNPSIGSNIVRFE